MGCYATRDPETVARLPGVVQVITSKERLAEDLAGFGVTVQPRGISRFDDHQRAFVKVQDGCLLNCSYCIIPTVRPVLRSRPAEEILAEVSRLVEAGYHEIVLTGIHLGHYGIDLSKGRPRSEWLRLWHLLDRLLELPGDFRIRLSSLEAAEARDDLVRTLARQPRICPHLHLCLQSGSDRILERMKRRYSRAGFLERCRRIMAELDQPAFSTDVIIGFPGESDEDFEATCSALRGWLLQGPRVFLQSPPGHRRGRTEGAGPTSGRGTAAGTAQAAGARTGKRLSAELAGPDARRAGGDGGPPAAGKREWDCVPGGLRVISGLPPCPAPPASPGASGRRG